MVNFIRPQGLALTDKKGYYININSSNKTEPTRIILGIRINNE